MKDFEVDWTARGHFGIAG